MGSAACALACFVFVFLKKSHNWGMQTHIVLLCLIFAGLAVEAKSSMGLLQRTKRFSQFKTVRIGEVWNELKSQKVVSYTLTRDLTVMLWISLHLLFWNGSIVENRRTGLVGFDSATDRRVDLAKIENFFMNPKTVSRNLMVCSGFFLLTASFWLIPSFLWKSSLASDREDDRDVNRLDMVVNSANTHPHLQEKTSGVVTALVTAGPADLYNRVLCPTCILQIIAINTLLFSAQLLFWSTVTLLPNAPS